MIAVRYVPSEPIRLPKRRTKFDAAALYAHEPAAKQLAKRTTTTTHTAHRIRKLYRTWAAYAARCLAVDKLREELPTYSVGRHVHKACKLS